MELAPGDHTGGRQATRGTMNRPERRRLGHKDYTIGWVCALPLELAAAQVMLDEEHESLPLSHGDTNVYALGRIGRHNIVIAGLPAGLIGTHTAASVAHQMKSSFPSAQMGLLVGVGGGVPSSGVDVRLGDVVVSQPHMGHGGVVQYDFGKSTPSGFQRAGYLNMPPNALLSAIAQLEANHVRLQGRFLEHLEAFDQNARFSRESAGSDMLFDAAYTHVEGPTCADCDKSRLIQRASRGGSEFLVHYGTIASGNQVIRDGITRDRLSAELNGVLCFEMEAAGIMNSFPCLVVRGICDYADSHKNKTWQPFAAATAAAYAKEVILTLPETKEIVLRTTKDADRDSVQRKPVSIMPFKRDNKFMERGSIFAEIDERLRVNQRVAIAGIGGIGKSQLAIEYSYLFQEEHPQGSVYWVYAGNRHRFIEAYINIATALGISAQGTSQERILRMVCDRLSDKTCSPWLMVIDNVDDMDTFFPLRSSTDSTVTDDLELLQYIPNCPNGNIIITTRDARVGERLSQGNKCLVVSPLTEQEAKELVKRKMSPEADWDEVEVAHLARTLDYIPLAITQATAFISENYCSVSDYLEMLQSSDSEETEVLNHDIPDPRRNMDAASSIIRTWTMSFNMIKKKFPRAAELLSLAAVLDRQSIPKFLLMRENEKKYEFTISLGTLRSFSLVESEKNGEAITLHRLVQLCTQDWLEKTQKRSEFEQLALSVLNKHFPRPKPETWAMCETLLSHVRKVTQYTFTTQKSRRLLSGLHFDVATYEYSQWREKVALADAQIASKMAEELFGPSSDEYYRCLDLQAAMLRDNGDFRKARSIYETMVQKRREVGKAKDPLTIIYLQELGSIYRDLNQLRKAEEMLKESLKVARKISGPDNKFVLDGTIKLSTVYLLQERWEEAEKLQVYALDKLKKATQPDHTNILRCMEYLTKAYTKQGRFKDAQKLGEEVVAIRKRVWGAYHPATAQSIYKLGTAYAEEGDLDEAEKHYVEALDIQSRMLGLDDHSTIKIVELLAYLRLDRSWNVEALGKLFECLQRSAAAQGMAHHSTRHILQRLLKRVQGLEPVHKSEFEREWKSTFGDASLDDWIVKVGVKAGVKAGSISMASQYV